MLVSLRRCEATLQVLAHSYHAGIITRWGVYLGPLVTSLKFIETTGTTFTLIMNAMAILNVATLKRLLRINAWKSGRLLLLL